MKAAWVLLLLVALSAPGFAQAPDDNLIVPGVRIGRWTLEMTIDDLWRREGEPTFIYANLPRVGEHLPSTLYVWEGTQVGVGTFDRSRVEYVQTMWFGGTRMDFRTDKGTGYDTSLGDVLRAYGGPTVTFSDPPSKGLIYDQIGLYVSLWQDRVKHVVVFRPGTAQRYWKF